MRVHRQHRFGGPETLNLEEAPAPRCPEAGYVVRTRAIGIHFADVVERRGHYRRGQTLPTVLGRESAGVVVERGPAATRFAPGDEVIALTLRGGAYAEAVAVEEHDVFAPPPGLGWAERAAFAGTYLTAWLALREVARVRPGESLLVSAAAGGLGGAAIQLGRALGCGPILGTAGSPEKCRRAVERGADACLGSDGDFRDEVRAWTGGRGVDACLESVGGEVLERCLELLAPLGRLVVLGFSSIDADHGARVPRVHPLTLLHRSIGVAGLDVDALGPTVRQAAWPALVELAAVHALRPDIGATYDFADVARAHEDLERRRSTGRLVLLLGDDAD